MDLGLHIISDDSNSVLDPEVIAIADRITPAQAPEFGKVWDLFTTRETPFATEQYDVLTRNYTAPAVTVTASTGSADWDTSSDTTALPVSSGTIDRITVGDVLLVEDEVVVVSSVDRSGNTVDVYERGAGDSTAVAHGTGAITAKIIGSSHVEGTANAEAMAETTGKVTNYCQLYEETIDLSKANSDQARKTGRTEPILKGEAMERVMQDLARSAIFGQARAATSTIPAMTRGLISYLQDIAGALTTAVSGAFTETVLKNELDTIRAAGGTVNAIVLSIANKRTANGFTGADAIQTTRGDKEGGHVLDAYIADGHGRIPFVVDIDFPNSKVALVNTRFMEKGWKINDMLSFVPFTNVNPREKKDLLAGKAGLSMMGIGKTHSILTDIS